MRDFKKYEVWKLSHEVVLNIYAISDSFPNHERYGIISQIRRASVSIPTNIAEGCGRKTDVEFARFIHISLGSAHELEYLLQLSRDLKFISEDDFTSMNEKINTVKRKLFHLERSLNQRA